MEFGGHDPVMCGDGVAPGFGGYEISGGGNADGRAFFFPLAASHLVIRGIFHFEYLPPAESG